MFQESYAKIINDLMKALSGKKEVAIQANEEIVVPKSEEQ